MTDPEPDLALRRPRADFHADSHPRAQDMRLPIEVADNGLRIDRDIKVPLHARHGFPEVWIVAIRDRQELRFAAPDQGSYQARETVHAHPRAAALHGGSAGLFR